LRRGIDTLLLRSAWINGLGLAVKAATVFPGNGGLGLPSVQGTMTLYADQTGAPQAQLDFDLVTRYKTVGDSFLATKQLAPPEVRQVLLVGAGRIAATALQAYRVLFPHARFVVWNHRVQTAEKFAATHAGVLVAAALSSALPESDVICCATLSREPVVLGKWLRPGQHLDLIGAFKSDMREADDEAMRRARIFVDSRASTLQHIGELAIPLASGAIQPGDVIADFYDIAQGAFARTSPEEITIFKNGGGAHLDLMTARYLLSKLESKSALS
jgi:ornithine cyclodeaminase